jgi:ornithine cyclodeaminase/alanine dehydrogenase-like protein (mu-crystallin family)
MSSDTILYLSGSDVAAALEHIDVIGTVAAALVAHGRGDTILPAEAYLGWEKDGEPLRSLCMPASIDSVPGVKIINANPANPARGLPRASGLTLLFEPDTGRPLCVMEAARISCLRTAAVTATANELLAAAPVERLALIGAGALARCHLRLLAPRLRQLREIRVYDRDRERATALAADRSLVVCDSAEEAIRGAQVIVTVTTATTPYIRYDWLQPGALLVNVSLDDPLPEVFLNADKLFVDDINLVAADECRLLGRMLRDGIIVRAGQGGARAIDGELGQLLAYGHPGRSHPDEIIVVNPFGLAIEDIAIAPQVHEYATASGLGTRLSR